jgi:hypothetical protein
MEQLGEMAVLDGRTLLRRCMRVPADERMAPAPHV